MKRLRALALSMLGTFAAIFAVTNIIRFAGAVEQSRRTLVRMTGATGQALRDLQADVRAIFRTVPESLDEVSVAVGTLNTLLGITGEKLQTTTRQALDFARANEVDVATATTLIGQLINRFNLEADDALGFMDRLTLAGQATGASVNTLASNLLQAGTSLATFGFSINEQIALVAELERRGISASEVTRRLGMSLARFADAGATSASEAWEMLIEQIQTAETDLEAVGVATEAFGSRGGQLALDIRSGALAIDELTVALENADGTLRQTEEDSRTAGQEFKTAANALLTDLIPAFEFLTNVGTLLVEVFSGAVNIIKATADLAVMSFVAIQRGLIDVRITWRRLTGQQTEDLQRQRDSLTSAIQDIGRGINELFRAQQSVTEEGRRTGEVFSQVREAQASANAAVTGTAEELAARERERLSLLVQGAEARLLEREETEELLAIYQAAKTAIDAGNLSLERRLELTAQIKAIEGTGVTEGVRTPGVGATFVRSPDVPEAERVTGLTGVGRFSELAKEPESLAQFWIENLDEITFAAKGAGIGIQNAFQDAFLALGKEGETFADFFATIFEGTAAAALGALAQVASAKVQENLARAVESVGLGLLGNPAAFGAAAKFTAAAALWALVGGAAGAAASSVGGGGGGGFRGNDITDRAIDRLDRSGPEITLIISGVDPDNPAHQTLVGKAAQEFAERHGGRITVNGRTFAQQGG